LISENLIDLFTSIAGPVKGDYTTVFGKQTGIRDLPQGVSKLAPGFFPNLMNGTGLAALTGFRSNHTVVKKNFAKEY